VERDGKIAKWFLGKEVAEVGRRTKLADNLL
jgi:hypothetical protein